MKFTRITLILLIAVISVSAQFYGVNKVQYEKFTWHYLQSEHFDVYFYEGGYDIARFTAEVAETAYVSIKTTFKYEITERVAIIIYNSHNDFQQTNVVGAFLTEGIGGVTELFKNRVVVPYEGDYDQFRHVIHHELVHAVMNDMLYGGSIQSLVSGQVVPVPLWFSEGLAEYESQRWNTELDMVVRDATITGYLPPIDFLDYMPYQGGASVFRYISQRYGEEKVSEIINKVKGSFRFDSAFKSALSIDFEDLTQEWQKQMKREYWPDIANRKEPGEIAKSMTNHTKDNSFRNTSPSISPMGDKIVFLSDRDGYLSIYLMDVLEGKVVEKIIQGETTEDFEELHFLTPGMSWSPDGKKFVFAAKAGNSDALYIYNFTTQQLDQKKFKLEGIFSPNWSPKGNEIAFVGNLHGASDIYIYNLETEELDNLTNDVFSDKSPSWDQQGDRLIFTSDRGSYPIGKFAPANFDMHSHNFINTDIFIMNRDGNGLQRITSSPHKEDFALFMPDGKSVAYISDRNGIHNIYFHHLENDVSYAVTNLLTGAFQLSLDKKGQNLAFSSFNKGGWDIFLLKNPLEMRPQQLEASAYFKRVEKRLTLEQTSGEKIKTEVELQDKSEKAPLVLDYSNYVFADMNRRTPEKQEQVELPAEEYKDEEGSYRVKNYKIKFSPDIINGAAGYDTFFGLQGFTQIALSDMLGNHKIFIGTNLVFDLRNSNLSLQYWYLPNRIDYGFNGFHIVNFFNSYSGLIRFRNFGAGFTASRPFNKFNRIDLNLTWYNVNLEYLQIDEQTQKIRTILPSIAFINDQIQWGYSGPYRGSRISVSALFSPKYNENSLDFQTYKLDYRKYFRVADGYSFAFRTYTGLSRGENPQNFFLGGVSNWFNRDFRGDIRIDRIEDVFFSEFVTPLRGARFYERVGHNFGLMNLEFRYPLITNLQLGLPPIRFPYIQGTLFADIGSAWTKTNSWRGVRTDVNGKARLDDLVSGIGMGARLYIFGLMLRWDVAWEYDLASTSKPKYYWSLGTDF